MGLRTAAGKLGFRLASANSRFSRRSIASLSTSTEIVEKEKISNLFLCFDERKQSGNKLDTNIVFRPIKLDTYNDKEDELRDAGTHRFPVYKDIVTAKPVNGSDSDTDSDSDSDDETYKYDREKYDEEQKEKLRYKMSCQTRIIRLGSDVLFTVGQTTPRDICWVNPSNHPVKFHVSSQTETKIKSFLRPKLGMQWGVIDGKIYCFDNHAYSNSHFQVLDPETDDSSWQSQSEPPFIKGNGNTEKYSVVFLNESKKILGWDDARNGAYCFDATKPENGWVESPRDFGEAISIMGQKDVHLVIHDSHPKLGDFNLMFSYDRCDEPFIISPFFISDSCDSFKCIDEPIRLPKLLCSKYRFDHSYSHRRYAKPRSTFDSQFVNLGSKKFCLVLHKFNDEEKADDYRTKGNILVATFKYDIVSNKANESEAPLEIKTRMLGTRRFRYYLENKPRQNDMIGAFSF